MKKCSRNGTAKMKKTRYRKVYNVNSHTSMLDGFYMMTQYQGSVATLRAMPTPFSFFLKCYRLVMIAGQYNSVCMCSKVKTRNLKNNILCPAPPYV